MVLINWYCVYRSTSVYMPDRRYDMLPEVLSGNLCSLHSNVDRFAFLFVSLSVCFSVFICVPLWLCVSLSVAISQSLSISLFLSLSLSNYKYMYGILCMYLHYRYAVSVMWKLSPNYEVEKVWYGRTVIRSAYKLTYEVCWCLFVHLSTLLYHSYKWFLNFTDSSRFIWWARSFKNYSWNSWTKGLIIVTARHSTEASISFSLCVCLSIHPSIHLSVCLSVCLYVCMRERDRETERQRQRETETENL